MKTGLTENKSLFTGYSRKKLYCLAKTYEELAGLYRNGSRDMQSDDRREALYRMELAEMKQTFAKHLEEISEAFTDVADTIVPVSMPPEHKKRALVQYLKKQGIHVREIVFIESEPSRCISIEARALTGKHMTADDLAGLLSVYFDRRLMPTIDSAVELGRGYGLFMFEDEPCFTVLSASARAVKENEKISGDNFSIEEYNQNQVIAMISDGMGSGERACDDSRCVVEFMEKFLEAGFSKEKALMLVNGAFFSRTPGSSMTTMDLCSINLLNGEADFIKAGAAASFVKHGSSVEEISADTMPLGGMEEHNAIQLSVRLFDTDMLVMVSDGVADAFDEMGAGCLKDVIAKLNFVNPKELAEHILKYAISCQGGHIRDDMTVLAMYINRNANKNYL